VLYNVTVGAFRQNPASAYRAAKAQEVLEYLKLADKKDQRAGSLTIADRKRAEIARALATQPKLLLLGRGYGGLRPTEVDEMVAIINQLREGGITVFVIEHIMRAIMALSDRIIGDSFRQKDRRGFAPEVASDEKVIKAYLGEEYGVS
jgi:branched-chain amino acid transport system ATP-binding protein